jgi:DNA-directed RNA polymerase specialized sigma24 family protein
MNPADRAGSGPADPLLQRSVVPDAAPGPGESVLPQHQQDAAEPRSQQDQQLTVNLGAGPDRELVRLVRAHGKGSPIALAFEVELKDAGVGALLMLYRKRMLFRRLESLNVFVPHETPLGFREALRPLVYLAVYEAVPIFIDDFVLGGRWDPRKASLRTAVVNACLCRFGSEYRRFCTQENHYQRFRVDLTKTGDYDELESSTAGTYTPRPPLGPEERAMRTAELEWLLSIRSISPLDKMILIREAQGYSHQEIAVEFGLKPSTVESRLRRAKKKVADVKERENEDRRDQGKDG